MILLQSPRNRYRRTCFRVLLSNRSRETSRHSRVTTSPCLAFLVKPYRTFAFRPSTITPFTYRTSFYSWTRYSKRNLVRFPDVHRLSSYAGSHVTIYNLVSEALLIAFVLQDVPGSVSDLYRRRTRDRGNFVWKSVACWRGALVSILYHIRLSAGRFNVKCSSFPCTACSYDQHGLNADCIQSRH